MGVEEEREKIRISLWAVTANFWGLSGGSLRYARYRTDFVWSVNQPFAYHAKNGAATNIWPASTVWFQCFPSRTHCNQIHVKTSCTTMGGKKEQNCSRWCSRRPSNELLVRLRYIFGCCSYCVCTFNLFFFLPDVSPYCQVPKSGVLNEKKVLLSFAAMDHWLACAGGNGLERF